MNLDFIVETSGTIFMIEVKTERDMDNSEVHEKAKVGQKFCESVTEFNVKNQSKKWEYVLIPHAIIGFNMRFKRLIGNYLRNKSAEQKTVY